MSRVRLRRVCLAPLLLAALLPGAAQEAALYRLSADAAAGLGLAAAGFDPAVADSAVVWTLSAKLLHRIEAPGWGLVLSQAIDLSGQSATGPAFPPAVTVHEAYARLDLGPDAGSQLFIGKRRLRLGIGSTFSPGDRINPRTGFWDQKSGFRGLAFSGGLGSELSLRAALSLDRSLEAYAAGLRAAAAPSVPAAVAAYAAALDGAAGPADPRLLLGALSLEAQLGSLQLALSGVLSPGWSSRPSLGLSLDLGGIILQAEAALEFEDGPSFFGTAGLRSTWQGEGLSLSLGADYDYNGAPGLLAQRHYLLPSFSLGKDEVFSLFARALVELEAPSARLSTGLSLYLAPGFDLEFTGLFSLGAAGGEFASLPAPASPGPESLSQSVGLAARVHF